MITECVILIVGVFTFIFMLPVIPLQNQTTKLKITKKVKSTLRLLLCPLNFSLPDRRAHGHRDYLIWDKIFNNDRR